MEVQRIMSCLMDAVDHCHSRNVVHRDLKPENVLIDNEKIKLCDFGFATQLAWSGERLTETCGTPGYAAPELLCGKPYGKAVDVFSLGVIAYILYVVVAHILRSKKNYIYNRLCGYPPFPMKLSKISRTLPALKFPQKEWSSISKDAKDMVTLFIS